MNKILTTFALVAFLVAGCSDRDCGECCKGKCEKESTTDAETPANTTEANKAVMTDANHIKEINERRAEQKKVNNEIAAIDERINELADKTSDEYKEKLKQGRVAEKKTKVEVDDLSARIAKAVEEKAAEEEIERLIKEREALLQKLVEMRKQNQNFVMESRGKRQGK